MNRTAHQSIALEQDPRVAETAGRGGAFSINPDQARALGRPARVVKAPPKVAYKVASGASGLLGKAQLALLPSAVAIMEMTATAMATAACLGVAAELGVADKLAEGPRSIDELAAATGTRADALLRVIRLLASQGVFRLRGERVSLSRQAQALRSDHPQSMRAWARMVCSPLSWEPLGQLASCVRSGRDAYQLRDGMGLFEWLATRPEESATFEAGMTSASALDNPAIVSGYDFSSINSLADVGGGLGGTLAAILEHYPNLGGTLVDQPSVVERAQRQWGISHRNLVKRVTFAPGDIFGTIPPGYDAYFMKSIIHDWNDADALRILRACRAAMRSGSRLLIAEMIVESGDSPHPAKVLDVAMLALTGGKERTAAEYNDLFRKAGLSLRRIVRTASPRSIIEVVVA